MGIKVTDKSVIFAQGNEKIMRIKGEDQRIIPICYAPRDDEDDFGCGIKYVETGKITYWGLGSPHKILASYRGMLLIQELIDEIWHGEFCACWYAGDTHKDLELLNKYDREKVITIEKKLGRKIGKKTEFESYELIGHACRLEILKEVPVNLIEIIKTLDEEGIFISVWELEEEIARGTIDEGTKEFILAFKQRKEEEEERARQLYESRKKEFEKQSEVLKKKKFKLCKFKSIDVNGKIVSFRKIRKKFRHSLIQKAEIILREVGYRPYFEGSLLGTESFGFLPQNFIATLNVETEDGKRYAYVQAFEGPAKSLSKGWAFNDCASAAYCRYLKQAVKKIMEWKDLLDGNDIPCKHIGRMLHKLEDVKISIDKEYLEGLELV